MTQTPAYVDGVLVEWGARLFWPKNRVTGRSGGAGLGAAAVSWRPTAQAVRGRIQSAVKRAPQVMVKVTGGGRGMNRIAAHFKYIARNGTLGLENERGESLEGNEALRALRDDWRAGGSYIDAESHRREAFNIMLSMPPESDGEQVRAAARAFAAREFANHQYVFVLHKPGVDDKTDRPHVHLAVRAEGLDGKRLNPRKADLQRWREGFAQALQERGIAARATRRAQHGEITRAKPTWHKHAHQRGGQVRRAQPPTSERELQSQAEVLRAWKEIATALAQSADAGDRATALEITKLVTDMPSTRKRLAEHVRTTEPTPERGPPR